MDHLGATKEGVQNWVDSCGRKGVNGTGAHVCHITCNGALLSRTRDGDITCPDTPWSECSKQCMQKRNVRKPARRHTLASNIDAPLFGSYTSRALPASAPKQPECYVSETRNCYTGACPVSDGDYLGLRY